MAALAARLRTELLPVARPDDRVGIGAIPGGAEGYADAVARHTTTDLSPAEIHQIGLDCLDELRPRWLEIGRRALGESDFPAIAGPAALRPGAALPDQRGDRRRRRAGAAACPARAGRLVPALRHPAVRDRADRPGRRRGRRAWPTTGRPRSTAAGRGARLQAAHPEERFRFEYEALAFHESVPGHHLQLATAQTLDLPRYRRHLDVEACSFNEGWGLYAERLAEEMGLYSGDLALLGMLSFAALRACRLVDRHRRAPLRLVAGAGRRVRLAAHRHHAGAHRQRGRPLHLLARSGAGLHDRPAGDRPAARALAAPRWATGSTCVAFHGAVLGSGALPLGVLDQNIARWTAGVAGTAGPLEKEASAWT